MKTTKTSFIGRAAAIAALLGAGIVLAETSAPFRADVRESAGALVATGVEGLGSADGSSVTAWDTTQLDDGWTTLSSDGVTTNVIVLNGPSVVGCRMSSNETWSAGRVHVVRDDVVVPTGVTLSIAADAAVKFSEGARIVVEDGGELIVDGAMFADFADDTVGGDANMDGDATAPTTVWDDWTEGVDSNALLRVSLLDGAFSVFPSRAYTSGHALGSLPEPYRYEARFKGWRTAPDGGGEAVSADTLADDAPLLYASWEAYSLDITPASTNLAAVAGNCAFAVAANAAWTVSTDAPWISLQSEDGSGDGAVVFSVGANESTQPRSGTVRVSLAEGGLVRDFTVSQEGMEEVATPTFRPGDGTTFKASAQRVAISCSTAGATIRYTLDGSDPTMASTLYTSRGFNVFDTTTVKARAYKDGMLPSPIASVRIIRLQTLAEALDVPLWTVTTDGNAEWTVDMEVAAEVGGSSARSGDIGDDEETSLHTSVEGSGTLSFRWKTSCEDDPDDSWTWDYLVFEADDVPRAWLDGQTDWQEISLTFGAGTHTFDWTFRKDFMDGDEVGEDCGWVDRIVWTPIVAAGDMSIPVSWFEAQGLVEAGQGADEAADADPDRDGLTTAEEYIAGTDPNDPESSFTATIEIENGVPKVKWTPDLLGERAYRVLGRKSLGGDEEWEDVTDLEGHGAAEGYRFFKAEVNMPK
ncbi:MAG: chitobiase/beta-hexosaminidase C-terminal domain-containing protein [Kiritimatiellae bacterium]|nr:chitobiase/beta-hexosaminidase C-terminal domain-containing protein [Kiritimatiellia bacterium]